MRNNIMKKSIMSRSRLHHHYNIFWNPLPNYKYLCKIRNISLSIYSVRLYLMYDLMQLFRISETFKTHLSTKRNAYPRGLCLPFQRIFERTSYILQKTCNMFHAPQLCCFPFCLLLQSHKPLLKMYIIVNAFGNE